MDLPGTPETPAHVDQVVATERRTQLGVGEGALHTVEHVLAAVAALEIDDLLVEMDGPEPPILDGSAQPFVDALTNAGIADRPGEVQYLEMPTPMSLSDGDSVYHVYPAPSLSLKVVIDFPHPLIGRQTCDLSITPSTFARELAPART